MISDVSCDEVPILCNLTSPELSSRRTEIQALLERATHVAALTNGVELEFVASADVAHALVDFILFERVCCSRLSYELRSEPDHSRLSLRLTAAPGQVRSLQEMYLRS